MIGKCQVSVWKKSGVRRLNSILLRSRPLHRPRLSHFSDFLRSLPDPNANVEAFLIGLSALDKGNSFITNIKTSLKAVLGAAGRLFPKAKRVVIGWNL